MELVELYALSQSQDFLHDWYMEALVKQARDKLGLLRLGYKYCLKIPAVLGGQYENSNLATISLHEKVAISGRPAKEIGESPDGAQIRLDISKWRFLQSTPSTSQNIPVRRNLTVCNGSDCAPHSL
ncbi:hypothetical protein CRX42_04660 [Pseudomonas jessenii]|uniref:T6SS immunity protein Tdi1 C-terminal domain-containing protein n=1 Tax=Pseudomonas jessenii TaxID=77298 RepID=A0A2W0ETR5_PSEJE|nr:hypothetical protein CRX42_04660 [Pseudomonas jessenii]